MWLLGADADKDAGDASVEKVTGLIKDGGGEVDNAALWGRRSLSYQIDKNKEGSYFLANFKLDSAATPTLERALDADQDVIRHILIRHDKPVPAVEELDEPEERGRDRGGRDNRRPRRS
jgi:small subunit ribosomal protein S6